MSTTRRTALAMTGAGLAAALTDFAAHAAMPSSAAALIDVESCPLARIIAAFQKGAADFAALPMDVLTNDNEEAYSEATYQPHMRRLIDDAPAATSLVGVAEAIRLAFTEQAIDDALAEGALRSALAYLDARIARGEA